MCTRTRLCEKARGCDGAVVWIPHAIPRYSPHLPSPLDLSPLLTWHLSWPGFSLGGVTQSNLVKGSESSGILLFPFSVAVLLH